MKNYFDEIISRFPVRRTGKEKEKFSEYAKNTAKSLGYEAKLETLSKNTNVVIGAPDEARVIFTAHYDTPAKSLLPNLMMPKCRVLTYLFAMILPLILAFLSIIVSHLIASALSIEELWAPIYLVLYFGVFYLSMLCFKNKNNYNDNTSGVATVFEIMAREENKNKGYAYILFDNEEKGLLGSKAYVKAHPVSNKTLVINLDCVGYGDEFLFIATPDAQEDADYKRFSESKNEEKNLHFFSTKECMYNSDNKRFKRSVGVCACKGSRLVKFYTPRIHTGYDTVVDKANIEFLSKTLSQL